MSFRIAVLASGEGTNLQAILDRVHDRNGVVVDCVVSNRTEAFALRRARSADVETVVFPREPGADRTERDVAMADWLEARRVELIVLAGYMELLSAEFVRRFPLRIVNVHPALLPAFPGLDPIGRALEHGARVVGVTVHFVDEGVDSGPIILQRAVEIPADRDHTALEERVHAVEHELLPTAIELIAAGRVRLDESNPRLVRIAEPGPQ